MKSWQLTKVMERFQRSLIKLVPLADEAEICWRDGESYDEWDRIAQALFRSFVVDEVSRELSCECVFADYDMRYSSYSSLTHIMVDSKDLRAPCIFIAYSTQDDPFDSMRVVDPIAINANSFVIKAHGAKFLLGFSGHPIEPASKQGAENNF